MKKYNLNWVEERPKKFYAEVSEKDFINAVKRLYKAKARFITATACQNSGQMYIFYHFEISKALYTLWISLKQEKIESISDIYPTANWIEREITELYGIKFSGKFLEPLLLTPDIKTPFRNE